MHASRLHLKAFIAAMERQQASSMYIYVALSSGPALVNFDFAFQIDSKEV